MLKPSIQVSLLMPLLASCASVVETVRRRLSEASSFACYVSSKR
jgi:hypothetical protein